jgi:hypothetical protein
VSSFFGSKVTAAAAIKATTTSTNCTVESSISKNSGSQHHHARVSSGKGVGEMPLAATVKSQMLRFLRRSKSTRGSSGGSSARSSRKKGGAETAMVIPNKRFSVLVDSPSSNNGMVTIAEPYTMALGAAVAVTASSTGSKHVETTKKQAPNNSQRPRDGGHRSSSQTRRHKYQVM